MYFDIRILPEPVSVGFLFVVFFFFKEINPKRLTHFSNYCFCNKCLERDQTGKTDEFDNTHQCVPKVASLHLVI